MMIIETKRRKKNKGIIVENIFGNLSNRFIDLVIAQLMEEWTDIIYYVSMILQRQEQKRSDLDEQLKEYIAEWRKQRAKEEEELKRLKVNYL